MTDALRDNSSTAAADSKVGDAGSPPDEVVEALADSHRREVLRDLATRETDEVPLDDLADPEAADVDAAVALHHCHLPKLDAAVALHHCHLPKLDAAGLVNYDADDRTVAPADPLADGTYDDLLTDAFL